MRYVKLSDAIGISAGGYVAGLVVGMYIQNEFIKRRLNKVVPLVYNAVENVVTKMDEQYMSGNDLRELINSEMNFISIALRK